VLIPYISNGPLIFWLYPVFGIRGASWFMGCSEWLFGALLFLGFWNKRLGLLGTIGSTATFIGTVSVHAERLGSGRWLSSNGRQRSLLDEGYRSLGSIDLLVEAGCRAGP
jgi:hypothetical protein